MKDTIPIYYLLCICTLVLTESDHNDDYDNADHDGNEIDAPPTYLYNPTNCWMTLDTPKLFNTMGIIDEKYESIRDAAQASLNAIGFDQSMIDGFIRSRGAALRELHANDHRPWMIPSGLNLGGYCMVRMTDSVLFFHRMKLRNNTYFRIDSLKNDLANMVVTANLSLHDLHLKGAYERSLTDRDPSVLIYAPAYGQVEFLLQDVQYKMEGRYRLIKNRLMIELINSEMEANNIMMMYVNQAIENQAMMLKKENLGSFMSRLKTDLDKWLKDYFNDVLMFEAMEGIAHLDELSKYDKEKESALEEYTDHAISAIGSRIRNLGAQNVRLPLFTFMSPHGLYIKLYEGELRGLDSMYRRSVATGLQQRTIYKLDTIVGFSNLKVVYKYEAWIPTGVPPLAGVLTFSANELTAHLTLAMVNNPETIDLDIEFLDQMKPESLTVEGAANVMISNFRHLLEHQITTIMSNTLIHGIRMLRSLPNCKPFLPGNTLTTTEATYIDYDDTTDNYWRGGKVGKAQRKEIKLKKKLIKKKKI